MANKQALRELQSRLAERLQAARSQVRGESWLAIECGGRGFLVPLREAGEIFALAPILPVPHSHRWFLGVANLRGHLHGIVDLAAFLGLRAGAAPSDAGGRDQARLVGFNADLDINCALWVDRLAGLRSDADFVVEPDATGDAPAAPRPAFAGARLRDGAGRRWQELLPSKLATHEAFLKIVG